MDDVLSGDLIYVFAFCLARPGLCAGAVRAGASAGGAQDPQLRQQDRASIIECGMDPIGDAWIRYSAVYYLYALVFVAFAVDVLFLIPVALVYNRVKEFVHPGLRRDADLCGDSVAGDRLCLEERCL